MKVKSISYGHCETANLHTPVGMFTSVNVSVPKGHVWCGAVLKCEVPQHNVVLNVWIESAPLIQNHHARGIGERGFHGLCHAHSVQSDFVVRLSLLVRRQYNRFSKHCNRIACSSEGRSVPYPSLPASSLPVKSSEAVAFTLVAVLRSEMNGEYS
jgi:hypothetical protein